MLFCSSLKKLNLFPSPRRMHTKWWTIEDWKWKLCSFKDVIMHLSWFYVMKPCIINTIILGLRCREDVALRKSSKFYDKRIQKFPILCKFYSSLGVFYGWKNYFCENIFTLCIKKMRSKNLYKFYFILIFFIQPK